jgi:ABC-2 type transport system permease protein
VSGAAQALRQVRYTNKAFWRNPASAFFTFAFPLMFLVIFTTLLGEGEGTVEGIPFEINVANIYVPAMAAFSVITACYTNIGISVCFQRDAGILKRTRGTPIPAWAYLTGRVLHAVIVAVILVVIVAAFGALFYDADIPEGADLFRFLVALMVGAATFAALGLAVTAICPNADASPAIVNATELPVLFLSGVFIPLGDDPAVWIEVVSNVFPVRYFVESMNAAFLGAPFQWGDVLFVAGWGLAGLILAARFFSWEPRK